MQRTISMMCAGVLFLAARTVVAQPAASNPYGIAGYISASNLQNLGFPDGISTYDWNNLRADLDYQMVRPFHYWYRYFVPGGNYVQDWVTYDVANQPQQWFTQESYPTAAPWNVRRGCNMMLNRYWGYYLDRAGGNHIGRIGLPDEMLPQWYVDAGGTHQQRFDAWITDHPGRTWLMGNEPGGHERVEDLRGQDALTDLEYAVFYHAYTSYITARDAGARFANAAMAMTTTPTWDADLPVDAVIGTWERILAIYATEYGHEMPVDTWNIHLYAGHGATDPIVHRQEYVSTIEAFRAFVDTTRGGIYRGAAMILTEFNGTYDAAGFTRDNVSAFLHDFRDDLNQLYIRGVLDEWFWFVSNGGTGWPAVSILESGNLTSVGEEYRAAAWHFEALKPPIDERYGTAARPFDADNGGLWNLLAQSEHQAGNTIAVDENHADHAAVTIDPGSGGLPETTLADERHLDGLGTFAFLAGEGVGIDLRFTADDAGNTDLFLGYGHGDGGPDGGSAGVILRALDGDATDTTILDAQSGETITTGIDFTNRHKMLFVVNDARGIDLYLDTIAAPTGTLSRRSDPGLDANRLRLGSNPAAIVSGRSFKGTVDVFAYAADDDLLHAGFTRIAADFDTDGDVDQTDFGHLQACYSGAGIVQADAKCLDARLDADDDVDLDDFARFQACLSGANVHAELNCMN